MASTLTTLLKLFKATPGSNEQFRTTDINSNWDKIDQNIGAFVCTSTTRPATPFDTQRIKETDTKRIYSWDAGLAKWVYLGGGTNPTAFGYYRAAVLGWVNGLQDWPFDTLLTGYTAPAVGSYNTATGVWTCGETGKYRMSAKIFYRTNYAGHGHFAVELWNSTTGAIATNGTENPFYVNTGNWPVTPIISTDVHCVAGQAYKIRGYSQGSSNTIEVGHNTAYWTGIKASD